MLLITGYVDGTSIMLIFIQDVRINAVPSDLSTPLPSSNGTLILVFHSRLTVDYPFALSVPVCLTLILSNQIYSTLLR